MALGRTLGAGIGGKAVLSFRHAHGEVPVTLLQLCEAVTHRLLGGDIRCAINFRGDGLHFVPQAHLIGVKRREGSFPGLHQVHDLPGEFLGAGAAVGPMGRNNGFGTVLGGDLADHRHFRHCIRDEPIDGHDHRHTETLQVLDMTGHVGATDAHGVEVLVLQIGHGNATVHLQRPQGSHQHYRRRLEARFAALDIEELFGAQVRAETRLGDHVVGKLEGRLGRHHRITAMGDVGERSAVNNGGVVLESLHQIRL